MKGMSTGDKSTAPNRKPSANDDFNAADAKFMQDMLEHHEMAIDMSDHIVKYGKNDSVVSLAKSIKKTQEKEIATMRSWLFRRNLPMSGT